MSERFTAWLAQAARDNELRLSMALLGLFLVVVWESMRLWPERWRTVGRVGFMVMGGLGYATLLAVGLYTLVRFLLGAG